MNLLLATALLLQDKTAEETFKKIEATVQAAKTVRVKFSEALHGPQDPKESVTGTLLMKAGNKLNLTVRSVMKNSKGNYVTEDYFVISEGSKLAWSRPSGIHVQAAPKDLDQIARTMLIRAGVTSILRIPGYVEDALAPPSSKWFQVSNFKVPKPELAPDKSRRLGYKFIIVTPQDLLPGEKGEQVLEYDPKTLRLTAHHDYGAGGTAGEGTARMYSEFVLDADIPDEKFKLPEEKK